MAKQKSDDELKKLKSGLMLSGGFIIFAAIVIFAIIFNDKSGGNKSAQTGLTLLLFIFLPIILVSLVTFVIFVARLLKLKTKN